MTDEKLKQRLRYLLAVLGLLLSLLLISSFGMWVVQEFLENFDGRRYGEAVCVEDPAWQSSGATETEAFFKTETQTNAENVFLNDILLDGNQLNDTERLQLLSELSLKQYGSYYGESLEREPIKEIELSREQAMEQARQFLEIVNSSAPTEYLYQVEGEINLHFRADKTHPSASVWVADFTSRGCIVFLYMDGRTGLPIRFCADYNPTAGWENAIALDIILSVYNQQTGNSSYVEMFLSYLASFLKTNFFTNPVTGKRYSMIYENGYEYLTPVEQWITEDYQYVLTCASRWKDPAENRFYSQFDLVLSPMENQAVIRNILTQRHQIVTYVGESEQVDSSS
ncbi:MAG: hypothetical protein HFI63_01995 [Lachnospiraceae bacterium]|nr:hypothetical protein [Lachnospiraceae bacterium]